MLIRKWKIRIQSDGRPAITFPSGRQDGVLLPEADDIELSDEGKNSEVSFLREALVFRNLGLEDIEKESISRKEEER